MPNNQENAILFEGKTLEEAYAKATSTFNCSLTQLKSEVLQSPSNGFLGLFKKNALIKVFQFENNDNQANENNNYKNDIKIKDVSKSLNNTPQNYKSKEVSQDIHKKEKIFDSFYENKLSSETIENDIIIEIKETVNSLFKDLCYDLNEIEVSYFDEATISIKFTGKDSALLIGKEGYRYKALSYILFNWLHVKYNLMLRLEIEQFLQNQEESMNKYLIKVIEKINLDGFYKTKTLDGILLHIALTSLRDEFPNKYVAIKTTKNDEKYIIVNDYKTK